LPWAERVISPVWDGVSRGEPAGWPAASLTTCRDRPTVRASDRGHPLAAKQDRL